MNILTAHAVIKEEGIEPENVLFVTYVYDSFFVHHIRDPYFIEMVVHKDGLNTSTSHINYPELKDEYLRDKKNGDIIFSNDALLEEYL